MHVLVLIDKASVDPGGVSRNVHDFYFIVAGWEAGGIAEPFVANSFGRVG